MRIDHTLMSWKGSFGLHTIAGDPMVFTDILPVVGMCVGQYCRLEEYDKKEETYTGRWALLRITGIRLARVKEGKLQAIVDHKMIDRGADAHC
jgi:hypothetical protein